MVLALLIHGQRLCRSRTQIDQLLFSLVGHDRPDQAAQSPVAVVEHELVVG